MMKAADGTKIAERWILIATGEGAASIVVSDLKEGLHTFSCCCGKTLDVCRDETVLYMLGEMNDPGNYSTDESGKPFQYRYDHECGSVTITRLDTWEELSAAEERERKLRTALREARGFIVAVEVEEGLTIDNLIEMIDSALKHGNEALEAR